MSTASRYHLHFDAGTEHVLPLSFVDEFGQALDVSCYEVSGVVLQQGKRLPVKAARPSATTAVISFPVLSSGVANYRLDMTSPAGTEIPMVFGTIHVMARETEASGTGELDALEVAIPTVSEQDVTIKVLGVLDLAEFGAGIEKSVEELKAGLAEHTKDALVHASAEEKEAWNAKLSPAAADERYGFAGSIPGQEVDGQSFSTNLYLTGNRCFAKSVDFDTAELKNPVLELNVDDKTVRFFDSYIESNGIAFFHTLYANNFSLDGGVFTGNFSGDLTGNSIGTHTGNVVFADRLFNEFNLPGFRGNSAEQTVSFNGIRTAGSVTTTTNPLTIHYAPEKQKVDVANLETKGTLTLRNPNNDAVHTEIYSTNTPMGVGFVFESANTYLFNVPRVFMQGDLTALSAIFYGDVIVNGGLSFAQGAARIEETDENGGLLKIESQADVRIKGKVVYLDGGQLLHILSDSWMHNSLNVSGKITCGGLQVNDNISSNGDGSFYGNVTTRTGIHALPLGKKTALGADAYGLSVSADGGLQLWGTHFLQGSIWGEQGLKMVQNEVSLTSTDSAAIGFDFANTVDFRTMPNDGDGHGVYRFQCWHWTDDSHSAIEEGAVDVRKKAAMTPTDESLLNRSENDRRYGRLAGANEWSGVQTIYAPDGKYGANKIIQIRDASGEYPGYNICFRNGGSLEIFDESQDPTKNEPYFQIYRPFGQRTYACQNFCVKGTTEMRKAVTLTSTSSFTANCPATFKGAVTFTQAPVVPNVSEPVLTNALNFHGGMGLSCMSQLFESKVNFDNWMTHAGAVSVTSNRHINLKLSFTKKNYPSLVGRVFFSALGATQGIYGGATGVVIPLFQAINGGDKSGWIKLSFEQFVNYNTDNFAKNYTLEDEDAFVIYPVGNTSSLLFDITYRCDSAKTYYRTRYLRANTSFASGVEMVEQNAVINFSSNTWGTQVRAYFIFGDTVQKITYIFVLVGNTLCKIAEMPYFNFYEQSHYRDIQVSVGGLGEGCYGDVAFTDQTGLSGISNINTGSYVAPWLDIAKSLSIDCVTERKEAVEFVPPVTEEASAE